ncbi:nuclear pore complex protein NUP1 isoform X2 [Argentina anserina]|uniref:nuclear pore complex protein NUP1 isoform X2 n=1 Tax=Argentina anserina TaxID=57926 RepID=UPI0021768F33|nr:nuclear pore complex protein NUP1 isoform X2 [Potentilla anserina]
MATAAREETQKQKQPYDALGAGGKLRKTPFQRTTRTTPYDRPLSNGGGWISKLVDPAQKLLAYSAHRLFSTVFHKRLTPPPPPSSSAEVNHEARIMDKEQVSMDPSGALKGAIEQTSGARTAAAGDGFTLVEQMLEQKTFTRPEINRLKELLYSRTDDISIENLEKISEAIPSLPLVSHGRKEDFAKTPLQDKSANSNLVSTSVVSTTVLDENLASPVELAKAYMGSRPSKISPLMLGHRSQAAYDDPHNSRSVAFPSISSCMSVVPRFPSNGATPETGFATPRSRGRSAIHSMARTPYTRIQTHNTLKGFGSTVDSYCAPSSSSRSVWEQSQPSGSKQGALKRRFSVLDNDIGSIGPIRRIRPKPNLLSSRGLSSPMIKEACQNLSSSTKKPLLLGEPNHTSGNTLSENGDNAVPRAFFSTVSSQSSKAASRIFEHLDKITSPKEKSSDPKLLTMSDRSPTKLSPSMLRGQALKSLEHVDSLKFLENSHYKNSNNLDVSSNQMPNVTSQKHDKVTEDGPSRIVAPCANEVESATEKKDVLVKVKVASDIVVHPPGKKRAFKMSAHEYLELDDDDYSNNSRVSGSFADGRVMVDKTAAANLKKPVAPTEVTPPASFTLNQKSNSRASSGVYTVAPGALNILPKAQRSVKADKNNSDAEVPSRVPETLVSGSSSSAVTTSIFSTTYEVSNSLASQSPFSIMDPTANTSSGNKIATISAVTTSSSNLFTSVSALSFPVEPISKFPVSTTTAVTQVTENSSLELLRDKNKRDGSFANSSGSLFPFTSATAAGTVSSFMGASDAASCPAVTNQSVPTSFSSGSGSGPSPQAVPGFLFKSEPATASAVVTAKRSALELLDDKNKQGGIFSTVSSTPFGGTSATSASASSNKFGNFAAASTPTFTTQSLDSARSSGGNGTDSSALVSPPGTVVASPPQSAPIQPGSSASSSVFNFAGNTVVGSFTQSAPVQPGSSASSSVFKFAGNTVVDSLTQGAPVQPGSSASSLVFNFAGNTTFSNGSSALGSSTPSSGVNPSGSTTAPSTVFSIGWQPSTSSKFSSTLNSTSSSPAFQFGASSATASTNAVSTSFGASSSFGATSNAAAPFFGTPSASVSTSSSSPTLFGTPTVSAPTSNSLPTLFGTPTGSAPSTSSASAFGMSNGALSTGMFSFTPSTTTALSQPAFGNSNPAFGFPMAAAGNNDQMVSMEDSMAEDTVHASPPASFSQQSVVTPQSTPIFSAFGQQPVSTPPAPFVFGGSSNGFQFPSQQNPSPFQVSNPQNPSPFQSNSVGSSFSLGAADKSNRRIVKINRSKNRKK